MISDLIVFTTGNDTSLLAASCAANGVLLATFDTPWIGYLTVKTIRALEFLQSRPEPYAMWLDGNDTLVLHDERTILDRFHRFGCEVVIGAEQNCWPDSDRAVCFPDYKDGLPRFPQAGGFIGRTSDVKETMRTVIECARKGDEDDTRAWVTAITTGRLPGVKIDRARSLFCAQSDGEEVAPLDPATRHWNGRVPGREEFWEEWIAKRKAVA